MKSIILLLGFASSVFSVETKEFVELAQKPSNYDAQFSVQALYKLKEDQKTERWELRDGPSDGGNISQMKGIRRVVEGGTLVETNTGLDFNNPKSGDVIEITRSKDKKVGWLRWRLYVNKQQHWVLESSWDGTEIRSGFIHSKMVSEFDGEGSEKNWRKGKVIKWVHERIDNQGKSVQAYSEPVGEDHITGIIYYSGSGISPPYR